MVQAVCWGSDCLWEVDIYRWDGGGVLCTLLMI